MLFQKTWQPSHRDADGASSCPAGLVVNFPVPGSEAALAGLFRLADNEKRGQVGKKQCTPRGPIDNNVRFS